MILFLVVGFICVAADEQVEEAKQNCNCSRLLHEDVTITDPPPTFPPTSFTCWGRYDGYYADTEVDCTIFHYCQTWYFPTGLNETVKWDFACPQSTIFNQKILSCTPPNISFDCQESPNYYWVNWVNLTESTTSAPTEVSEYSTPSFNIGQQLIVGGVQPQEVLVSGSIFQESSKAPDQAAESGSGQNPLESSQPQEFPALDSTSQESSNMSDYNPESGSKRPSTSETVPVDLIKESSPEAIRFPV